MKTTTISPAPPDLPGLNWQSFGRADLSALVELATACRRADGGLAFLLEPAALQDHYFPDAPGSAIGAFRTDGRLAACASVHIVGCAGDQRTALANLVHPDWRGRGVGKYLMGWSLARVGPLAAGAGADRPALQIRTETLTDAADRLYRAFGFAPIFEELVMQRDLHGPLPDRPLDSDVTLAVWHPCLVDQFFQAYDASFRDRPGFPRWSAEQWVAWVADDDLAPEWTLLALRGEIPLGFLTASADPSTEPPGGYISQIGVIPEHRRRGLASALIVAAMQRMQASGAPLASLTVNTNNPGAILAYDKLDFAIVGRRARYERPG